MVVSGCRTERTRRTSLSRLSVIFFAIQPPFVLILVLFYPSISRGQFYRSLGVGFLFFRVGKNCFKFSSFGVFTLALAPSLSLNSNFSKTPAPPFNLLSTFIASILYLFFFIFFYSSFPIFLSISSSPILLNFIYSLSLKIFYSLLLLLTLPSLPPWLFPFLILSFSF